MKLLELCSSNVIMLTNDGYFRQKDELAMGSPPVPLIANCWMSKFDPILRDNAVFFSRYLDDVVREIKKNSFEDKVKSINNLHPSLKFTYEEECENRISFLDMRIIHSGNNLSSTWFQKKSHTGLTMNYYALAPTKYKKSVVSALVHRIFPACSSWQHFHEGLVKGKSMLARNQYHFLSQSSKRFVQ